MVKITIFTPSYNRAQLLPRLYKSLQHQTFHDFEWLIVDDGSTDDTEEVVNGFIANHDNFQIRYFKKTNGGKHTAINFGVNKAIGELFFIVDSDDELPTDALLKISQAFEKVHGKQEIGGVCGYMAHRNGKVIGCPTTEGVMSILQLRFKKHVTGDMAEVFRTEVLRKFPFPEIPGERFCPEMLVWNRTAPKYQLYVFPEIIYLRDYLDGGLTDNIVRIRMQSPIASMMTYQEMTTYNIPLIVKFKSAINYWRFWCCRRHGTKYPKIRLIWYWTLPLGWLMHIKDRKMNKF